MPIPDASLLLQAAELHRLHPTLSTEVRAARLVAEGVIRGNALTACYRVRISYELGSIPCAFVLEPVPQRRHPGQPVIHTNSADNEPCLFTPARHDWRSSMSLARTIVPWLMEWLVFYEAWRLTGHWQGGGQTPAWYDALGRNDPRPAPAADDRPGVTAQHAEAAA